MKVPVPFLAPALVALSSVLLPFAAVATAHAREPAQAAPSVGALRTVILVRHAEKASDDPKDPGLSEPGRERARNLARLLARSGATRLLASEFRRTQATLAPLAAELGLTVEPLPARDVDAVAQAIASSPPGATVVVAGHSNTLPDLAARLGAPLTDLAENAQGPVLDEHDYGRVFVLTLPPPGAELRATVLELAY